MANVDFDNRAGFEEGSTLVERVRESLQVEILEGRLKPGTRLVRRALAKRLGVSPMPVAEAIAWLERDGLVESRPQAGARVLPVTADRIREDEILREAVECQVARLCATQAPSTRLLSLKSEAEKIDRVLSRRAEITPLLIRLHMDFHLKLAELAGSTSLLDLLRRTWFRRIMQVHTRGIRSMAMPPDWHRQLLAEIATGDPDRADRAMRRHVRGPEAWG